MTVGQLLTNSEIYGKKSPLLATDRVPTPVSKTGVSPEPVNPLTTSSKRPSSYRGDKSAGLNQWQDFFYLTDRRRFNHHHALHFALISIFNNTFVSIHNN